MTQNWVQLITVYFADTLACTAKRASEDVRYLTTYPYPEHFPSPII